jgi:hypothetical protein
MHFGLRCGYLTCYHHHSERSKNDSRSAILWRACIFTDAFINADPDTDIFTDAHAFIHINADIYTDAASYACANAGTFIYTDTIGIGAWLGLRVLRVLLPVVSV